MIHPVSRRCIEIGEDNLSPPSRSLADFRDVSAYVLLGEPGAGKTTVFKREKEETNSHYVTARDFITFDDKPEWHERTLFIDGLDEIRAGAVDQLTPLDEIRSKLYQLGTPKFRLSCRIVDWLGASDQNSLQRLLENDESVKVLRLEPLSLGNIEEILARQPGITDTEEFIETIRQEGLDALLDNPLSLEMLALALNGPEEDRPHDRTQIFNLACSKLLEGRILERKSKRLRSAGEPDLLMLAGKLFAIQLLTGHTGYRLNGTENGDGYLPLNRLPGKIDKFYDILDSRLFRASHESQDCVEPYHRCIAEFLGAKYLAQLVSEGLPVARILALTTGYDGGVVPEFRGLIAWLATHSTAASKELIERDPYGVVEYGCVREFSADEKYRILKGLERETRMNTWFGYALSYDGRLGDLASTDMKENFLECFKASEPDDAQQSFACLCLQALVSRDDLSGMSDFALKIIENPKWGLPARRIALDLFIQQTAGSELRVDELTNLLEAVEDGRIFDPYDDLCGRLLETVYPEILSPPQVLPYLRLPKRTHYFGPYCRFWTRLIVEQSTDKQLGELLDLLAESSARPSEGFSWASGPVNPLHDLPTEWLEHYLENVPEEPDSRHLLRWLETVRDTHMGASSRKIGNWLSNHPETLLEVYGLGIDQCVNSDQLNLCMYNAGKRLANAVFPKNFGLWCLERASETTNTEIAQYLIRSSANCLRHHDCHDGLSQEVAKDRLSAKPDLLEAFTKHLEPEDEGSNDAPAKQYQARRRAEILERQKQWHAEVKPMQKDLRENRGHPNVLHDLATAYYGGYRNVEGNTPEERLENLLGKDKELVQSVLQAFRISIDREDLPSVKEVFRLGTKSQMHFLSYPYMAGLHEISETSPDKSLSISEEQVRLALAIYYTVPLWPLSPDTRDETPQWFPSLLHSQPQIVAEILVEAVRTKLHRRANFIGGLHKLAQSPEYKEVARMASLPLLRAFPVRGPSQQLQDLISLFITAALYCEKDSFLKVVAKKLSCRSMHVGHRICWLAAGLLADPGEYLDELESYVGGNQPRIQSLAKIMTGKFCDTLLDSPSVPVLSRLIRLLGTSYRPLSYDDSSTNARFITLDMGAALNIQSFCKRLAQIPTREATREFDSLLEQEELDAWHPELTHLAYQQKILRRETEFCHGNIEEVFQVIKNGRPANPADLAAVAMMKLEEVAKDIRDGHTSGWQAYWTSDADNPEPRHENFCRNRLLDKLEPSLEGLGINVASESLHANDTRSDICFLCNGSSVPAEIKKSRSPDLWSAIRNQLIPYTRNPRADRHGIYIVFWFGEEFCTAIKSGARPRSTNQLKQCLHKTLSEEEKCKIKICVIDVSRQP